MTSKTKETMYLWGKKLLNFSKKIPTVGIVPVGPLRQDVPGTVRPVN